MEVPAPSVPPELLDGWELVDERVERLFEAGPVTVRARVRVYGDRERRRAVRKATGVDAVWRFFFASRLRTAPRSPATGALTRLVRSRAAEGFADEIRNRGFSGVRRQESRSLEIRGTEAHLRRFEAACRVAEAEVPTEAYLATVPGDREYVLAGGAYPLQVGPELGGGVDVERLSSFVDPANDRRELLDLIRGTE